jgi:hypothetical protein
MHLTNELDPKSQGPKCVCVLGGARKGKGQIEEETTWLVNFL